KYTIAQYKPTKSTCNESEVGNLLNREFNQDQELKVVVSDLTYVRVDQKWHYICILVDLYNREIIGYSAGSNKTAALVQRAFASVTYILDQLDIFLIVRSNLPIFELSDGELTDFWIERSLCKKVSQYNTAVAEAMLKTIKAEFIKS